MFIYGKPFMKILENIDLLKYNTFQVPSTTKYFVWIENPDEIFELIKTDIFKNQKKYFLWNGANTIFTGDFDWLIVKINIKWKEIVANNWNEILVKVWAGETWNDFVNRCADNDFAGAENLAYIPSSIWATAVQNIWAYGSEAKDIIYEVEWVNLKTQKIEILKNNKCNFAYRDSIFKHGLKDNFVITSVTCKLKNFKNWYKFNCEYEWITKKIWELWLNTDNMTLKKFISIITEIRQNKLPDWGKVWTVWSFFKNPVISDKDWESLSWKYPELKGFSVEWWIKLSAWQLIDLCGFRWKSNWKVWTYQTHALILVNEWWAKWKDVLDFSQEIQKAVKSKFWVDLEPEAIFVD